MSRSRGPKLEILREVIEATRGMKKPLPEWLTQTLGFDRGVLLRNVIKKRADEALAAVKDSDDAELLQNYRDNFLASFDFLAADSEVSTLSRAAALSAILYAFSLGRVVGDPKHRDRIIQEYQQSLAAIASAAHKAKSAPRKEETRTAVRTAMQGTNTKPTRGVEYAKLIQPKVVEKLGRNVSPWQIRNHVRAILEETPGKSGKPSGKSGKP